MTAAVGGASTSNAYNGDGLRVSSTSGGVTTRLTYDVAAGLPVLLGDGAHTYVWGPQGLAYEVDKTSGAVLVAHADGLGSIRALTDSSGSVVQTSGTDEFGVPDASLTQGSLVQPFGYTGEPQLGGGLVDLRARLYDPSLGRFVQADPLRKSGPGMGGWKCHAPAQRPGRAETILTSTPYRGSSRVVPSPAPTPVERERRAIVEPSRGRASGSGTAGRGPARPPT